MLNCKIYFVTCQSISGYFKNSEAQAYNYLLNSKSYSSNITFAITKYITRAEFILSAISKQV